MADEAYFTKDELEAHGGISWGNLTESQITTARLTVEATIERECGTSFVYRTHTATLDGTGKTGLWLPHLFVRTITSVTVDAVEYSESQLSAVTVTDLGYLVSESTFTDDVRNVTVVYTAGYSEEPPADLKWAAIIATRARVVGDYSGRPTISVADPEGGTTRYALPGPDRPFGIPEVDEILRGYNFKVPAVG